MKHLIPIFFLFIIVFPFNLFSKNITVEGTIKKSETQEPLAFINVAISGTYFGTVSNAKGAFRLVIPEKLSDATISFSAIGYENYSLPISKITGRLDVSLKPFDYPLREVVVMPDSTLRLFLKKAYNKISENYPDYPTRSIGFYRESIKQHEGDYLYITESILDVYKTSYKNKSDGQVKIVKSRKNVTPGSDTINYIHFYGGVFAPHNSDLVKNRKAFLKPSKDYEYALKADEMYNGRNVYCITFQPKDSSKGGYEGEFYLDKIDLAYLKFDYHANAKKLEDRENDDPMKRMRSFKHSTIRTYEKIKGKYYLKSIFDFEQLLNKKTNYLLDCNLEYILTELKVDSIEQIPFKEQISYSTVILDEAEDYQISSWKDYTILQNETIDNKFLSVSKSDSLLTKLYTPSEPSGFERLLNVLKRFESDINFIVYPVSLPVGNYKLVVNQALETPLNFQKEEEGKRFFSQTEASVKYKLTKQFKLVYTESENISNDEKSTSIFLGLGYSIPLKTYGKRIFFSMEGGYNSMSLYTSLGEVSNNVAFDFGGKKFDSSLIEAFYGVKANGIRTRADLSFQLNSFLHLKLIVGRDFNLNQKSAIKLVENKGFFFSRKTAEVDMANEAIEFFYEGQQLHESNFELNDYHFGIGISMCF